MLGVATLQEGIELRQASIDVPVLILSPPMEDETEGIAEYDLSCTVPSLAIARALAKASRERGKVSTVHVEVDTGMGRSGVGFDEAPGFISALTKLPELELEGIFTHFPASDDDRGFTERQVGLFLGLLARLEGRGIRIPLRHAANSGGILGVPSSFDGLLNMVRPGLAAYGLRAGGPLAKGAGLNPVMSFKSRIAQVRPLPAGHTVSYGRTFSAERAMLVGVVPVGYGHGFSWRLSNCGEVLVRGRRAPVVGRVTMDMTMIALDEVRDAMVGDEVVLFGRQGNEEIAVDEVARRVGTINYEIICGIGRRVARVYVSGGETVGVRTLTERRGVWRGRHPGPGGDARPSQGGSEPALGRGWSGVRRRTL
jgi:alanine racemase